MRHRDWYRQGHGSYELWILPQRAMVGGLEGERNWQITTLREARGGYFAGSLDEALAAAEFMVIEEFSNLLARG